jgi:ATPase subunit of ABC transporter with duplicated ATPase domains
MNELTEQVQQDWAAIAVQQSKGLEVVSQQDYDNAAELCKDIKSRINQIADYWKPLKEKAYGAWKDICTKEKQLMDPFTKAETAIKDKMKEFQRQKMEAERQQREEQERQKREEAEMLLKEAAKADEAGDSERSAFMFEAAENVQNMRFEQPKQVKTEGTARKAKRKARVTNPSLVPISIAGAIIRPIDEKVLNDLARASKGNMAIPGVEFYEDVQIAIRSR